MTSLRITGITDGAGPKRRHRSRASRMVSVIAGLAVVTVMAGAGWFTYSLGTTVRTSGVVPLIVASTGEIKMRPENPGGAIPPYQDVQVYNRVDGGGDQADTDVTLRPDPEEPLDPVAVLALQETAAGPADAGAAADGPVGETIVPEIRPADAVEAAPPPPADAETTVASATAAGVTLLDDGARAPEGIETGPWRIQVAALREQENAVRALGDLRAAHPDLFSDTELFVQRADLGDRGIWFRAQAGPFPAREAAGEMCAALEARAISCLVVRN